MPVGYEQNALMRAMRTRCSRVIGVLVPDLCTGFFPDVVNGIERAADEAGYEIVVCQTHMRQDATERRVAMLRERRVDGIIAMPISVNFKVYERLCASGQNLVFIDRDIEGLPVPAVLSDDVEGADRAVSHLIRLGRRRIATFVLPWDILPARRQLRFEGYRQALQRAGLPLDDALVAELVEGATVQDLTPRLTTVDQRPELIGRTAAGLILDRLDGKPVEPGIRWIETELIVRESCGAGARLDRRVSP